MLWSYCSPITFSYTATPELAQQSRKQNVQTKSYVTLLWKILPLEAQHQPGKGGPDSTYNKLMIKLKQWNEDASHWTEQRGKKVELQDHDKVFCQNQKFSRVKSGVLLNSLAWAWSNTHRGQSLFIVSTLVYLFCPVWSTVHTGPHLFRNKLPVNPWCWGHAIGTMSMSGCQGTSN